eukprot:14221975-Alexandrium_andersonii.AAC.1
MRSLAFTVMCLAISGGDSSEVWLRSERADAVRGPLLSVRTPQTRSPSNIPRYSKSVFPEVRYLRFPRSGGFELLGVSRRFIL